MKTKREIKNFYSFKNYKPNKNAVPVTYKGTEYLSKAQCMALEGITRKELDAYLKGGVEKPTQTSEVVEASNVNEAPITDSETNLEEFTDLQNGL